MAKASLFDAIKHQNVRSPSLCILGEFIRNGNLTAADQKGLWQALADRTLSASSILRGLQQFGFKGTAIVIRRHRALGCRTCGKKGDTRWRP